MPEGIYVLYPSNRFYVGDDILFMPSARIERFMLERGYLDKPKPLLKKIVATTGDKVCIKNNSVYINGKIRGNILHQDSKGRSLPIAKMCEVLKGNTYYVMGVSSPKSFDSRYYGLVKQTQILGKVRLIWSR